MRALLKSQEDSTLMVVEFYLMDYDRDDKTINLHSDYDDYIIYNVSEIQYNDFAQKLNINGFIDLSLFVAELD